MPIDPADIAHDETQRIENQRANRRDQMKHQATTSEFAVRMQARLQKTDKKQEIKDPKWKDGKEGELKESLLQKVVEVFQKGEEGTQDDKKNFEKLVQKKEEKKEELKKEKSTSSSSEKSSSVSEEGHARVASKNSDEGSSQGGGSGGGSQSDGQSSGQGQQQGGSSNKGQSGSGYKENLNTPLTLKTGKTKWSQVTGVLTVASVSSNAAGGGSGGLSDSALDQLVESIQVAGVQTGEVSLEVEVSADLFLGLKIKATQQKEGLVITLSCPDRNTKNLMVLNRIVLYDRLKDKGLRIFRIDIV